MGLRRKTAAAPGGSLLLLIGAAGILAGALPSCAALKDVPIRIGIQTPNSDIGYSSKSGLEVRAVVERRSAK